MLTRVDVQSENPFFLQIRDARPTDSIIVEKIEGLNPPDIDVFMGEYARDGGAYSGRRVPSRDVTFTLGLNPNYKANESVSGLRKMLMKAFLNPFATANNVNIILHDDEMADRILTGYVSKFEGDVFSDDTTTQIVMRCPNPYIVDVTPTVVAVNGPNAIFDYEGSASAGLEIVSTITTSTNVLHYTLNGAHMLLNYNFQPGDTVYINTRRGERRIAVTRTVDTVTTTTDILYARVSQEPYVWLDIRDPENTLKAYGTLPTSIVANITSISFRAQHWGV